MQGRTIQRFGFGTKRQGWQRRRKEEGACPGSAWGLNGKVGRVRVGFSSRRRPLRSSPFDGRGAHPRIWRESCWSPLKFAQRRTNPQRKGKMVHSDPCHKRGQERTNWTACETPGRHQGGRKGPFGQPGRHQGGRKGPIGQPARHQGGRKGTASEAPGRHLQELSWTRITAGK